MTRHSVSTGNYTGPDRRQSSDDERAAWRRSHPESASGVYREFRAQSNRQVWWLLGLLASLVVAGASGIGSRVFDAVFVPRNGNGQAVGSDASAEIVSIRRDLDRHVAKADATVEEYHRDQSELTTYREKMDERTQRIERKLDLILSRLNISHNMTSGAPNASAQGFALAAAPASPSGQK